LQAARSAAILAALEENLKMNPGEHRSFAVPRGMRIEIGCGLHLHVQIWGTGMPRILFVHGFGDGAFVWEHVIESLDVPTTIAALDLRGHGDSAWDPRGRYSQRESVSDLVQIIEAMNLNDLVLVGHSLGAETAIRAALAVARRVKALVLVDGGATPRASASDHMVADFCTQSWQYASPSEYADLLASRLYFADRQILRRIAGRALRATEPDGFVLKCDPALRNFVRADEPPIESFLPRIECPTLLLRGAKSAFLPLALAREARRAMRHCELADVPMAGHAVMLDNPAGLCAALAPFLTQMLPSIATGASLCIDPASQRRI
jgi:pimeloyl-ACP methyl ester carboxylesterase